MACSDALYPFYFRFLETEDEYFDYGPGPVPGQGRWRIYGIGLPDRGAEEGLLGERRAAAVAAGLVQIREVFLTIVRNTSRSHFRSVSSAPCCACSC